MQYLKKLFLFVAFFFTISLFAQQSPFVRFPSLNSNGTKIAFTYQGDIWVTSINGGKAERLTIHEATEINPLWSSDDQLIAFSSNRFGNNDIFTIPAEGGVPKRLTYHSAADILNDFTRDGKLLFTTSRNFKHVEWDHEFGVVSSNGGTPELLLETMGEMPSQSPDGKFIAFVNGWGRVTREAYKGSANNDIWIHNTQNKIYTKLTDFDGHDNYPKWADSRTLVYISAKSGRYNLYTIKIDNDGNKIGSETQITNFTDDGIRYFNISVDGSTIVFEKQTDIYTLNLANKSFKKVNIDISADYRFDPLQTKTYSDKMTEYQVSPNGKYSAFVVRGEIFISENDKDKNRTVNLTNNPYRDQQVVWLNDSTLIFSSDRNGQYDLFLITSDDKKESNLFKTLKHKTIRLTDSAMEETLPVVSPDGSKILYLIGNGKLVSANIDKVGNLTNQITLLDGWATPQNINWSPDSKWIAYASEDLNFNGEIFIQPIDNSISPINVSMHPRTDSHPVWSKDGSKLAFVSQRNNNNQDVWFAWLRKEDWEKTKTDWDEFEKPETDKKKKDNTDSTKVLPIRIDAENIYERLVQVTNFAGDEGNIEFSKDGEIIYFSANSPTEKGSDIFSIKWDGKEIKSITKDGASPSDVSIDKESKFLYYASKGKLNRINLKDDKKESLTFSAKMEINFEIEKEQKFEEAWRALNDGFYDPNFHGNDWAELKNIYKPWCLAASTDDDFQDMFNFMLGQLNASHMGLRTSEERENLQKEITGLLGCSVTPLENGVKVTHLIQNTPSSKENSKLEIGDIIKSVNGVNITSKVNFYSLFKNTSDEKLLLLVSRNGKDHEIIIRPVSKLTDQLYDEWVENNRKLVDTYSKGKLGYLHIQAMGWESFERFEREFTAKGYGKDGIVIDVRYNGGGWTTDFLMTVLNYKQHAYTIPRGAANDLNAEKEKFVEFYPFGERLPYSAWTKPSIALCNQNSYSNAEIFSHAYKNLGIGKLVGVPTFGAVISTGSKTLIDGSTVRMPFRGWFVKADNSNMDFVGAVPDIIVNNNPDSKAKGEDPQLQRAVEELLKEVKK